MSLNHYYTLATRGGIILDADAEKYLQAIRPHYSPTFFDDIGVDEADWDILVNDLFLQLKEFEIYDKIKAFYPLAGGTPESIRYNAKDPRNANNAFRLTAVGSPTVSAFGVQGNGTSQYYRTHLNNNQLSQNESGMYFYSRTNSSNDIADIGGLDSAFAGSNITSLSSSGNFQARNQSALSPFINIIGGISGRSDQLIGAFRTTSSNVKCVRNTEILNEALSSLSPPDIEIYLLAANVNGSAAAFSNRQYSFFGITDGITTDTEILNNNTSVQNFIEAINRNV